MPMMEIVVEDVKLQSVWIPVLRTLATLVKVNEFRRLAENMKMCLFFVFVIDSSTLVTEQIKRNCKQK